jgi:hypothetical protein
MLSCFSCLDAEEVLTCSTVSMAQGVRRILLILLAGDAKPSYRDYDRGGESKLGGACRTIVGEAE